jgi:hypothetical protein
MRQQGTNSGLENTNRYIEAFKKTYSVINGQVLEDWSLMADEEKWRRIITNREKQGRGMSSFDRGQDSKMDASTVNISRS